MEYDFKTFKFGHGIHDSRADGMCIMEAVAYIAGEPHSDEPKCVSRVLGHFMAGLNDAIAIQDDQRRSDILGQFVFRLPGTASEQHEETRRRLIRAFGKQFCGPLYVDNDTEMYDIGEAVGDDAERDDTWTRVCRFVSGLIRLTEVREVVPNRKEPTHA